MPSILVRSVLEIAIVVAVGGMLWSAVSRIRAGRIGPAICRACHRPTSRAYPRCQRCDAPR